MRILKVTELNEEVFMAQGPMTLVDSSFVQSLKIKASGNNRERARLCAHRSVKDKVHEMLIVLPMGIYVRPHKHPNKSESFHIIEGNVDIVVFDDDGEIMEVVRMGDYSSGKTFYWRLSESLYHMVIPRSQIVIFHESTSGPFDRTISNVPAPWAPEEHDEVSGQEYRKHVSILSGIKETSQSST